MTKEYPSEKVRDRRDGYLCAAAFHALAEPFVHRIGEEVPEGSFEQSHSDMKLGELVAAATNLAFALELYMKTHLTGFALPVPQHHDLGKLYSLLPEALRTELEDEFKRRKRTWYGRRRSITVAKGPVETPTWDDREESAKLGDLLERSGNLFQSWRYIYEFTPPKDGGYQ